MQNAFLSTQSRGVGHDACRRRDGFPSARMALGQSSRWRAWALQYLDEKPDRPDS
jgi:hypothetical protein